jgi:hypothetical protein
LKDAGADPVFDFTDAGFVSTYRVEPRKIERILVTLMANLTKADVDAIVLEVADGVLQAETAAVLESPVFKVLVDSILFAARDSMGAVAGVDWLKHQDLDVAGLSGVLTASPLQCREAPAATGLPTYTRRKLADANVARKILGRANEDQRLIHGRAHACVKTALDDWQLDTAGEAPAALRFSG